MVLEDASWLRHLNCSSCTNSTISRAGSREQMRPSLTGAQTCWAFPLPFLAFLLLLTVFLAVFLWWICISSLLVQFQAIVFIWEVISGSPREEQGKGRSDQDHQAFQRATNYSLLVGTQLNSAKWYKSRSSVMYPGGLRIHGPTPSVAG